MNFLFTEKPFRVLSGRIPVSVSSAGRANLPEKANPFQFSFCEYRKRLAVALLATGLGLAVAAPVSAQDTAISGNNPNRETTALQEAGYVPDGLVHIKGKVFADKSESPLPFVGIYLKWNNDNKMGLGYAFNGLNEYEERGKYKAFTKPDGTFEIAVPVVELGENYPSIKVRATGYQERDIQVESLDLQQPLIIHLREVEPNRQREMGGCAYPVGETLIREEFWSQKRIYLTRTQVILAKATFPFWKLKKKLQRSLESYRNE